LPGRLVKYVPIKQDCRLADGGLDELSLFVWFPAQDDAKVFSIVFNIGMGKRGDIIK
jgi:hypothetical protein